MPLTRGYIVGYQANRMCLKFTMLDPAGNMVDCEVSTLALDAIDGTRGASTDRDMQFARLRDRIERIASDIFDEERLTPDQRVGIYSKHFAK